MTRCRYGTLSRLAIAGLLAVALGGPAGAVPVPVAAGVFVERDSFEPGQQPDGNSVIFDGPRGIVILDTGRHAAHTQALLDFAQARHERIVAVVNSHWHLDHLGGNALLRERVPGLKVIASTAVAPALRGWLADSRRDMQAMLDAGQADAATAQMLRIDIALIDRGPLLLLPDVALAGPQRNDDAGRPLEIGFAGPSATAGDLWILDPASGVLASGDLVTLPVPFLDTACPAGWRRALGELDAQPFTTLVPGHGAPMSHAAFATWRQAFGALLDCAASDVPAGRCSAGWLDALGPLLPADGHRRAEAMLGYYLAEVLRAPAARRERDCTP